MRICGKIFIISLHNLKMLFMLWINNKFSECLAPPLHKQEGPQWKTFWRRFCPGPQTRGAFAGSYPQIFSVPPKFCCVEKYFFQTYDKTQNLSPWKMYFSPQTSKPGCGSGSAKIVSAIRIFFLKSIRPRDVALHNFFYKSPLGGPLEAFWGGSVWLIRRCCLSANILSNAASHIFWMTHSSFKWLHVFIQQNNAQR